MATSTIFDAMRDCGKLGVSQIDTYFWPKMLEQSVGLSCFPHKRHSGFTRELLRDAATVASLHDALLYRCWVALSISTTRILIMLARS